MTRHLAMPLVRETWRRLRARRKDLPAIARAKLKVSEDEPTAGVTGRARHRARACTDGETVWIRPCLEADGAAVVEGVLAHELAHCWLIQEGLEHSETECDIAAEELFGVKIRYNKDDVQTTGRGGPRKAPDVRQNPAPPKPRAREADMLDAIQHADLNGDQGWTLDDFQIIPLGEVPLSRVRSYEDWGAWIDVDPADFKGLSTEGRLVELASFRGSKWADRAAGWLKHGVPPIVVIDAPVVVVDYELHRQIGDGRGRVNFALAMGLKTLPVVLMKWRHPLPPAPR